MTFSSVRLAYLNIFILFVFIIFIFVTPEQIIDTMCLKDSNHIVVIIITGFAVLDILIRLIIFFWRPGEIGDLFGCRNRSLLDDESGQIGTRSASRLHRWKLERNAEAFLNHSGKTTFCCAILIIARVKQDFLDGRWFETLLATVSRSYANPVRNLFLQYLMLYDRNEEATISPTRLLTPCEDRLNLLLSLSRDEYLIVLEKAAIRARTDPGCLRHHNILESYPRQ